MAAAILFRLGAVVAMGTMSALVKLAAERGAHTFEIIFFRNAFAFIPIVAYILAGPLAELSDSFATAVRPGGRVMLSGLLDDQAEHILAVYGLRGLALERHVDLESGGALWRTLLLVKP